MTNIYFPFLQIEDNVDLNEEVIKNKREFCSVCTAEGHSAHNCLQAPRVMGTYLPKNQVFSYLPLYSYNANDKKKQPTSKDPNDYTYQMMSFNENFKFNWSDDVGKYSNSLYNRFRDNVGLKPEDDEAERRQRGKKRSFEELDDDEVEIVNIDYSQINQHSDSAKNNDQLNSFDSDDDECDLVIDEKQLADASMEVASTSRLNDSTNSDLDSSNLRESFSFNDEIKKVLETREFHLDIDVNNQLSEWTPEVVFENNCDSLVRTAEALNTDVPTLQLAITNTMVKFPVEAMDATEFIPLDQRQRPGEEKSEGKLLLTEQQANRLMDDGGIFLKEMEEKYELNLKVAWDPIALMLTLYGTHAKQKEFLKELGEFCKKVTLEEHKKQIEDSMQCMPKNPKKLINFILEHLQRLKNEHKTMRDLTETNNKMKTNMRAHEYKAADRQRKILNLILLGKFGLSGGKDAVIGMVRILDQVENLKFKVARTPEEIRKELSGYLNYIFTAIDHGNYDELLHELSECNKNHNWPLRKSQINNVGELRKLVYAQPLIYVDTGGSSKMDEDNDGLHTPDSTTADNDENSPGPGTSTSHDFIPLSNKTIDLTASTNGSIKQNTPTSSTHNQEEVLFDPRRPQDALRYHSCVRGTDNKLRTIYSDNIIEVEPQITHVVGIEPLPVHATNSTEVEKTPQNNESLVTSSDQNNPIKIIAIPENSNESTSSPNDLNQSIQNSSINKIEIIPSPATEQTEATTPPDQTLSTKELAKCSEIVNQAMFFFTATNNTDAIQKLKQVKQKIICKKFTQTDYASLLQIEKIVQEKLGTNK